MGGYAYAADNPATHSDPTGLMLVSDGGGGCGPSIPGCPGHTQPSPAQIAGQIVQQATASTGPPWAKYNGQHLAAVMGAVSNIVGQLQAQGFDPAQILQGIQLERTIPGGSKKGTGFPGFADITFTSNGLTLVWEVKAGLYGEQASLEAQGYVAALMKSGVKAQVGFPMVGQELVPAPGGLVRVYNGPPANGGGILYDRIAMPDPQPNPVPNPNPAPVNVLDAVPGGALIVAIVAWVVRTVQEGDPVPVP